MYWAVVIKISGYLFARFQIGGKSWKCEDEMAIFLGARVSLPWLTANPEEYQTKAPKMQGMGAQKALAIDMARDLRRFVCVNQLATKAWLPVDDDTDTHAISDWDWRSASSRVLVTGDIRRQSKARHTSLSLDQEASLHQHHQVIDHQTGLLLSAILTTGEVWCISSPLPVELAAVHDIQPQQSSLTSFGAVIFLTHISTQHNTIQHHLYIRLWTSTPYPIPYVFTSARLRHLFLS